MKREISYKKIGIALIIGCFLAFSSFYSVEFGNNGKFATFSAVKVFGAGGFGENTKISSVNFVDNESTNYIWLDNNENQKIALNTQIQQHIITVHISTDYATTKTEAKDYTRIDELTYNEPDGGSTTLGDVDEVNAYDEGNYFRIDYIWNSVYYTIEQDGEYEIIVDYDIYA